MSRYILPLVFGFVLFVYIGNVYPQNISSNKHNLSVSGPGSVKAASESEICIFCHAPHASSAKTPLWNRNDPSLNYTLYTSSTKNATMGQPDGASIKCLSCHDGSIALGSVVSRSTQISMSTGNTYMPTGKTNLTKDLSNDHPISFTYDANLATADGQLKSPSSISSPVKLYDNKVQCTSCHDPHKNNSSYGKFLVSSTQYSALCTSCHSRSSWTISSHYYRTKTWNGSGTNPWQHTTYTTVQANACENCHNPHNAGGAKMLLNASNEEDNCYPCHNGNVASKNIYSEFSKSYRHKVASYTGVHDPTEANIVSSQHVECVDCHNPHQADSTTASRPNASNIIKGVKGIDTDGNSVSSISYEYQLCYRCHTTSSWRPGSPTTRQISQNNVRLEFDSNNPSYHPVEAAGQNASVPSLITPWTTTSRVYCSDCHASNGTNAPKGPHGSSYSSILKYRYETADNTTESAAVYALCYACHSRTSILNDASFERHNTHIADEDTPCNVCHDPHGISSTQGNSTNNSNLINFDVNVVSASSSGILRFEDRGTRTGRCYLTCHGENHNPLSY